LRQSFTLKDFKEGRTMTVEEENKAVVQRFYEEVFNQGREEVLDEIIAPDYIDYGHEPLGQDRKEQNKISGGGAAIFSNTHYTIDEMLAIGDRVITRWAGKYNHTGDFLGIPASGKPVSLSGISIYRVENGKIQETRNAVNWLGLLQQLGVVQG
jgi:predicted ester cyclase